MSAGSMRMIVPPSGRLTPRLVERAYMSGPDQIPWPCRTSLQNGELLLERNVADSGKFHIPWPVEGHGEVVLCTGTLMERDRPYHLLVELARGKLNQVRNQIADWQSMGLAVPAKVEAALSKSLAHLSRAVTTQHEAAKAAEQAERAIVSALDVADLLVAAYVEQAMQVRRRQATKLRTWMGANLGNDPIDANTVGWYVKAFNAAIVPFSWRSVESLEGAHRWDATDQQLAWCRAHDLAVCGGPLVRPDREGLPDWLYVWEGDFNNIQSFVSDYVESVVTRHRGAVHAWQCAARVNLADALSLTEEQRLRLAVRAIEITHDIDPQTPLIVRIDQPWAEYMSRTAPDLSPLHFADALVRSGLHLSAVGLEINMGYEPGTYMRDRLELSRLLDLWSYLGLPLHAFLTVPGGEHPTPLPRGRPTPLPGTFPGGWSPENQAAWIKHYLPVLFAKPAVEAIFWNQLRDFEGCEFPYAGLVDSSGAVKPALPALAGLRKKFLD
ncbi:MAG TPA: endo-1,4-beta-xylanase [Pirellulales bacterium]|jgi:hypothetical protein|nr:endo-1,4-beta-xylanase [Pirellulales bacterium]